MNPPSGSFDETAPKPQSFGNVVSRMMRILWRPELARWRPRMALALFMTLVSKILAVIAPVFLGDGINRVTEGEGVAAAAPSFTSFFLLFAVARFLSNGLPQARDAFFVRVTQEANRVVAVEAFGHAQSQSLQFHLTRRAGAINRIIERGAGAVEFLLRFLAFNIGPTIVELALAAAVMAALYSWKLAAAAVITIVLYVVFTVLVTERRNAQRRLMNEADTNLRAISADTLTNFETVKAFAAEKRETARYDAAMNVYNDRYIVQMQSLSVLNTGQEFVMTAGLLAAALIAAYGVQGGSMKPGDITAVILMLTNIYRPLNILGFAWREIKQGAVDIEKLFELLDLKPQIADRPDAKTLMPTAGSIRFDDVSFVHEGRDAGLDRVTFDIPGGAFVGIVGPSGAGKSTILKLLFRFYDPASGRVLIDGEDIASVTQASLRAALGLVPQEVVLFNDTLRFNLAYAKPGATEAEVLEAADRAQLGAFIKRLPKGLDTRVGERGLKLSGGEKQRVGVARAVLLDPAILVLDEATSSLDSETEEEVQTALADAAKGRTTIAVAHRLSTIARADLILVLDAGRIIERGDHDALMRADGLYARLWRRQTEEGEADAPTMSGDLARASSRG
ncbi:MAG: ABC transporter ATP-binding protein/permease [Parvularculaceae bacterium]|nr:ABC transporter ATP-binding protein/permease [Parvularculaceae bacterium]